ncbi:hypothetical protein LCGC14_1246210 [marine sediment metagenome]|uniref:Uncharacterized protein n=1 Tax=marine sediment metagenome TaxID=412755 RepID=A0A0F9NLM4_9ZZZZ
MTIVYAIVHNMSGPPGHGDPGPPYLALAEDGNGYELGIPFPVFTSEAKAEEYRVLHDRFKFYRILPLDLVD